MVGGVRRGISRRRCQINLRFGILLDHCCLAVLVGALGRGRRGGEGFVVFVIKPQKLTSLVIVAVVVVFVLL